MAVRFRACPRCSGDMHLRSDHFGEYRECFQCGNVHYVPRELPLAFKVKLQKGRQKPGRGRTAA